MWLWGGSLACFYVWVVDVHGCVGTRVIYINKGVTLWILNIFSHWCTCVFRPKM